MPSPKILAKKKQVVSDLSEELKSVSSLVFTDYKGLSVAQDTEMRSEFRKAGVTYRVVKNSVSSRAFEKLGVEGLDEILKGPTALAFSTEDVVTAPRLVKQFVDKFKKMEVKGGVLDGAFVGPETIQQLASIPPMDVLYTRLVSTLMYPITKLAITLNLAAEKLESGEPIEAKADAEEEKAAADNTEAAGEEAATEEAKEVTEAPEAKEEANASEEKAEDVEAKASTEETVEKEAEEPAATEDTKE